MNIRKRIAHVVVGNKFPPLLRKHDKVSRGKIHENNKSFSSNEFLINLKHHLSQNLWDVSKVSLLAMNEYNLKKTAVLVQDHLGDDQ